MLTRILNRQTPYQIQSDWVSSPILRQNLAGIDPVRLVHVFLPQQALQNKNQKFPVFYCLAPWTSSGGALFQWEAFRESLADRLHRLMEQGALKPCVVVCPDLWTPFGGSQYIDSSYLGEHARYLIEELVPYIEANYPVIPGAASRAVFGRSSGGFGALRLAMDFPGTFAAVACHSGDMGFETLYRPSLVDLCYGLARYSGRARDYLEEMRKLPKLSGRDIHLHMLLGMAASYSPDQQEPDGYRLPIDPLNGELREEVWEQWLAHDPIHRIEKPGLRDNLAQVRYLYLDCGNRDQYHLHFGLRQWKKKWQGHSIHQQIFEFDDNHSGTSYRYDVSLPLLSQALVHDT